MAYILHAVESRRASAPRDLKANGVFAAFGGARMLFVSPRLAVLAPESALVPLVRSFDCMWEVHIMLYEMLYEMLYGANRAN